MAAKKRTTETPTKKVNIEDRIQDITLDDEGVCWLLYGRSGTGKTTLGATFPKPLLVVDLKEKGTDSIYTVKGAKRIKLTRWSQLEELYWYLKDGKHPYKSVMLDTLTQAQDMAQQQALKDNNKDSTEPMSKRDFGVASGLLKTWIINYRDLIDTGLNVCFIAQDRTSQGDDSLEGGDLAPEVGPRLMPSVASHANAAVKVIGHTFIRESITRPEKGKLKTEREIKYGMRIGPHSYYTTKIRVPKEFVVPETIWDPSFDKVMSVIRGEHSAPKRGPVKKG